MSNQLARRNNGKSLAMYGDRDEVREMADRIKRMLPGGSKMSDGDALGLAQIGLAHDLDPFNKEVWLIFNEETGKSYGVMVGIVGWRKHARKQSEYWGVGGRDGFIRITDPNRLAEYGATSKDIVYEYHIADSVLIETWSKAVKTIRDATGLQFIDVEKMVGPMPESVGIGIWQSGTRSKMAPYQAAMYRAERDCLRRRFQVKFGLVAGLPDVEVEPDEDSETVVAEYIEAEEHKSELELLSELGWDAPPAQPTPEPQKAEQPAQPAEAVLIPDELQHLAGVCNSEGTPYPLISTDKLGFMSKSIAKSLSENHLTPEQKAEHLRKQEAIGEILKYRNSNK